YSCQVSVGVLASAPLTGKNISVGLRTACTIQFADAQSARSRIAEPVIRIGKGAPHSAARARLTLRQTAELALSRVEGLGLRRDEERRARARRVRVGRGSARGIVADGIPRSTLVSRVHNTRAPRECT